MTSHLNPGKLRSAVAAIFSFPAMCMFLLIAVIFRYSLRGFAESDIWWHLRNAQMLLHNHRFPNVDSFSFTAAGSPWMNFEWLAEVPFYLAFTHLGLRGLLLVYFAVLIVIYAVVYYRCCQNGADCKDGAIATLAAICLGGVSIAPRTLLFGWLCMVILLLVLDKFRQTGQGPWLLFLPPLFTLWINLHGSWVFGVFVFVVIAACGLVEGEWGRVLSSRWSRSQLAWLLTTLLASGAALFLNPFGYRLVFYPFDLLSRQSVMVQYMEEWQPIDFGTSNGKIALVLLLGVLAAALFSRQRWRLDEALLTAFALWTAFSHVRFLFFAGLIVMPILAPRLKLFPPYDPELDKPVLNAAVMAIAIFAMAHYFPSNAKLADTVDNGYPKAALEFIAQQHIEGKVFNQYKFGGYMEWFAPGVKTFIDGRADLFVYNGVFNDFLKITTLDNSLELLQKHGVDYVLYEPQLPLTYLLDHSPSWRLIYHDKSAVLFQRIR